MHHSVFKFFCESFAHDELKDKRILDVGSYDVNGSVRSIIEPVMSPKEYIGIDMRQGPKVDIVLLAEDIVQHFGKSRFDVVISTEAFEHIEKWREAINNVKQVLVPGGTLLLTTRSQGFPLHDYPSDFWRFSPLDMAHIFADFRIKSLLNDPEQPGVFLKAIKPLDWTDNLDISNYNVFSMV